MVLTTSQLLVSSFFSPLDIFSVCGDKAQPQPGGPQTTYPTSVFPSCPAWFNRPTRAQNAHWHTVGIRAINLWGYSLKIPNERHLKHTESYAVAALGMHCMPMMLEFYLPHLTMMNYLFISG